MKLHLAAALLLLASLGAATAQVVPGCPTPGPGCVAIQSFVPVPGGLTVLAVTTSSARSAIAQAAPGFNIAVKNAGTDIAYFNLGDSSVTATSANTPVLPDQTITMPVGSATYIAGLAYSSSSTLEVQVGTGTYLTQRPGSGGGGAPSFPALTASNPGGQVAGVAFAFSGGYSNGTPPSLNYEINAGGFNPLTPATISGGAWSGNVTIASPGTYTLTVQWGGLPGVTASTSPFSVSPGGCSNTLDFSVACNSQYIAAL